MVFSRMAAAIVGTIAVSLVSKAWATEAGGGTRAAPSPAGAPSACARPVPGQADADPASEATWSFVAGAGVQVRIAIGEGAVAVNSAGGVVAQPQSDMCRGDGRD